MRLFARRAGPDLYFNRVPSLPATADGRVRPLAENLSTGAGGTKHFTWDEDAEPGTADAGASPDAGAAHEADGAEAARARPRWSHA